MTRHVQNQDPPFSRETHHNSHPRLLVTGETVEKEEGGAGGVCRTSSVGFCCVAVAVSGEGRTLVVAEVEVFGFY